MQSQFEHSPPVCLDKVTLFLPQPPHPYNRYDNHPFPWVNISLCDAAEVPWRGEDLRISLHSQFGYICLRVFCFSCPSLALPAHQFCLSARPLQKCSVGSGHEFLTTPVSNDRNQGQAVSLLAESRRRRLVCCRFLSSQGEFANHRRICEICSGAGLLLGRQGELVGMTDRKRRDALHSVEGAEFVFNALSGSLWTLFCSAQEIKNIFWLLIQRWKSQA